jgi:predicted TIM-barrel fold metal-dependent hydrolase
MELIYENGTPEFRGQWPYLEGLLVLVDPLHGHGDWSAPYLALPQGARLARGHESWIAAAGNGTVPSGVAEGVLQQNAAGRLAALDAAGVARQVISPGPTIDAAIDLPSNVAAGVLGAYNQYILRYCDAAPERLKAVLQVHGGEPHWSAREICDLAGHPSVAAVSICLPVKLAPDERNFRPIWEALEQTGLPVLQREAFSAGVWSPSRVVNYLRLTGVLERYPTVRIGFVGGSAQWLETAIDRLTGGGQHGSLDPRRIFAAVTGAQAGVRSAGSTGDIARECLLWESRYPLTGSLEASLAELNESLPETDRRLVLEANPFRFLHG